MNKKRLGFSLALLSGCSFASFNSVAVPFSVTELLEDNKLDVTLKNVWMLNGTDSLSESGIGEQAAWAQGIHLDYESGEWNDTLGFGASWYGVAKLYANSNFAGRDLLQDKDGHAQGFNKLGQLYAKANWGNNERYALINIGWKQFYKYAAINITRSRAAPSTYEGVGLETGWDQFSFRGALVDRFSERDSPDKSRFYTLSTNKRIPYLVTGAISWKPSKRNALTYIYGESKDYIRRHAIEGVGTFSLNQNSDLSLKGYYYHNQGLGEWEGARGFTHSAKHIAGVIGYRYKSCETGLAWAKTDAHLNNNLGRFYWHFGKNTRGAFNSPSDGPGNDYVNDGEQMLYLYSQHKFSDELTVGVYGYYGWGIEYIGVDLKEWEYGGFVRWLPNKIEGFSFLFAFGPVYSWKLEKGKPWLTRDKKKFQRAQGVGGGATVEYRFGVI